MSLALAGRFLTTAPPGKPLLFLLYHNMLEDVFFVVLFCWFHCLLTDFEFCIFRFISLFWSGTFTQSTAMLRWENLEGSLTLQNVPIDKIYFSCLKNSVRLEDQVLLYCFPD